MKNNESITDSKIGTAAAASDSDQPDMFSISAPFDLSSYLKEKRVMLDDYLSRVLNQLDPDRHLELVQAMKHSLMAGGKRLRPVLALAAAEACGGNPHLALPSACAIEMIHTYSLIHDDLPAMDDDDLRRGVPTCHKAFSEATAVLAGDALLTHAFTLLTDPDALSLFAPYPDKSILFDLVAKISHAAGPYGMLEGQMMDMQAEGQAQADLPSGKGPQNADKSVTGGNDTDRNDTDRNNPGRDVNEKLAHLEKLHALKTGRMIVVSVEAGAVSVGANADQKKRLTGYAQKIGLAFQVVDDILNVEGDPEVMGKAVGSDALNEKMTYPALMGLDASKAFARNLIQEAIDYLEIFGNQAAPLKAIANYIIERQR